MQHSPQDLLVQARKHLMNIVVILKDGDIDAAIKAVLFGLFVYLKHGNLLIRQEKKEFQNLLVKAVNLISLDPLVKQVSPTALEYEPKKETELLTKLRALPPLLEAVRQERESKMAGEREQSRLDRLEKGKQLITQRYFDGALQHFRRLSDDFPQDAALHAQIGKILFDINHVECITFLEKAAALDPADHKSLAMMGVALRKTKKFDQAERAYIAALDIDKDNINYLFNLSRVYIDSTNWAKAQEVLGKVLALDPSLEPAKKGLEFCTRHCRDSM